MSAIFQAPRKVGYPKALAPSTQRFSLRALDSGAVMEYFGPWMGINYQAIGIGIGLLIGIWALVVADTDRARAVIGGTMLFAFFLPMVWHAPASRIVSFLCWILLGLGSFVYVKWKGEGGWLK